MSFITKINSLANVKAFQLTINMYVPVDVPMMDNVRTTIMHFGTNKLSVSANIFYEYLRYQI